MSVSVCVSIIIPTRNKAPRLRLTLAALASDLKEQLPGTVEVIVVNDGSSDNTPAVLSDARARFPALATIAGGGRGRAGARNIGAAAARGHMLVFLDDDVLIQPGFLAAHSAHQQRQPGLIHGRLRELVAVTRLHDPAVGRPGLPSLDAERLALVGFEGAGHRLMTNALERAVEMMFEGGADPVAPWLAGAGANLSIPRTLFETIGGYDERFDVVWGCEDLELALRLCRSGAAIGFAPDAPGVHMSHLRDDRWEEHAVNLRHFTALHPLPEVMALPCLLGPDGDPARYFAAVAQQRSA